MGRVEMHDGRRRVNAGKECDGVWMKREKIGFAKSFLDNWCVRRLVTKLSVTAKLFADLVVHWSAWREVGLLISCTIK